MAPSEVRSEWRRLVNLLLFGHGAGLLLLLNARIGGLPPSSDLRVLAWGLAFGLVSAFLAAYVGYSADLNHAAGPTPNREAYEKKQGDRITFTLYAALASAIAFVGCLLAAVEFVGPRAVDEPPVVELPTKVELPNPAQVGTTFAASAEAVDGDTLRMLEQDIRLHGYDTPEAGATCGDTNVYDAATEALGQLVLERRVHCQVTGYDRRTQRNVARCSVNGNDLGSSLVSGGHGRDWPQYSNGEYADEEATARSARLGVWADNCPATLWPSNRDYSPR